MAPQASASSFPPDREPGLDGMDRPIVAKPTAPAEAPTPPLDAPPRDLRLACDLAEIERVLNTLEEYSEQHGVPRRAVQDVELALEEVVTNVISYGFEGSPEGLAPDILVRIVLCGGALCIEVMDNGVEFNPLDHPDADITLDEDERRIGGLGIHLLRQTMKGVEYRREDGKNMLFFRRELAP